MNTVRGKTEMMTEFISDTETSTADNIITFRKKMKKPDFTEQEFPKKGKLYLTIKRIFDVTASCIGLVVLSPLLIITAEMIKA